MIQQNLFYAIVGSKSYGADLDGVSDFAHDLVIEVRNKIDWNI